MDFRRFQFAAFTALLSACSADAGSVIDDPATGPGGKADTGFYSDLAVEIEGTYHGELVIGGDEQIDDAQLRDLIQQQVRFGKNPLISRGLHPNFLIHSVTRTEMTSQEDGTHVAYEVVGDLILPSDHWALLGVRSAAEAQGREIELELPADPRDLVQRIGDACSSVADPDNELSSETYFTRFDAAKAGCRDALPISRVSLTLDRVIENADTYPEYDKLIEDGRLEILLIVQGNSVRATTDLNQPYYEELVTRLMDEGFSAVGAVDGTRGVRLMRSEPGLVQIIDALGPADAYDELHEEGDLVRDHEIVIFNAHGIATRPQLDAPATYSRDTYQILGFYNCWGYDLYAKQALHAKSQGRPNDPYALVDIVAGTDWGLWVDTVPNNVDLLFPILESTATLALGANRPLASWGDILTRINANTSFQDNDHRQITGAGGVSDNHFRPATDGQDGQQR